MDNIIAYKASDLCYVDSPISEKDKTTLHQVILTLKGLTPETKDENIFILVKQNLNENYILFYKKKFHQDTSTITDYLAAIMMKQHKTDIIRIFNPYHQSLAKDVIWDDGIPKNKEEQELDDNLDQQLDWVEIMDLEEDIGSSNTPSPPKILKTTLLLILKVPGILRGPWHGTNIIPSFSFVDSKGDPTQNQSLESSICT